MKTSLKILLLGTALIILVLMSVNLGNAQPPGLPSTEPSQAPIAGGLGVLAAAGASYALKKLKSKKH